LFRRRCVDRVDDGQHCLFVDERVDAKIDRLDDTVEMEEEEETRRSEGTKSAPLLLLLLLLLRVTRPSARE
jgi:hypothetical protein